MVSKRCGCASDSCSCVVTGGVGVAVSGSGSKTDPYILDADIPITPLDVEENNVAVRIGTSKLDFRGAGVDVTTGDEGEAIVTIAGAPVVPKMQTGTATIPAAGALSAPVSVAVTFTVGLFTAAPVVIANVLGTGPNLRTAVTVSDITKDGCTLWVAQPSGTLAATPVNWFAIQ